VPVDFKGDGLASQGLDLQRKLAFSIACNRLLSTASYCALRGQLFSIQARASLAHRQQKYKLSMAPKLPTPAKPVTK
jgi:hypothetical protein